MFVLIFICKSKYCLLLVLHLNWFASSVHFDKEKRVAGCEVSVRPGRTRTGCRWGNVSMGWRRQRWRSVALRRQTPLSSQQRRSTEAFGASLLSSDHDSSGFDHLPVHLLRPGSLLNHVFVSPLHKPDCGPLNADPCRERSHKDVPD